MAYEARCHCGKVRMQVDAHLPEKAVVCNCSHCRAKGMVLAAVPRSSVTISSGADSLKTYRFNTRKIDHLFCAECGTQPFAEGRGRDGSPMAMINVRCVPEADLDAIEAVPFDGASL